MGLLGKTLEMLPKAKEGADGPRSPGLRLWPGHRTNSGAGESMPTMEAIEGEQEWC